MKMKIGIGLVIIVLVVMAGYYATKTDEGIGLQIEEIPLDGITGVDVLLSDNPVVIKQGDTDKIVLSLMNNDRSDSILNYHLEDGRLTVEAERASQVFDLSLNPDRIQREILEITIPAAADFRALTIQTGDSDSITLDKVAAASINITTVDGDIRLTGIAGEVNAQTREGTIAATAALSAEIVQNENNAYSYQGMIGGVDGKRCEITIVSVTGDIQLE